LVGTVSYMSPEQAQGKPVDPRSDVFSLGIVLYEMATGRRPFEGDNNLSVLTSILRDTPPAPTAIAPSAPRPLDAIIKRSLDKSPAARYADASGVRDDLRALQASLVSGQDGEGVAAKSSRKILWIVLGVLAIGE